MEKKNTLLLTVIAVATLLVAVVGATFAYFGSFDTNITNAANINVTTETGNGSEFVTTKQDADITVKAENMLYNTTGEKTSVATGDGWLQVDLSTHSAEYTTTCKYDVEYVKGTNVYGSEAFPVTTGAQDEFTYKFTIDGAPGGTKISGLVDDGTETTYSTMPNGILYTGATITSTGEKTTTQKYSITLQFYNFPSVDQSKLQGKTYSAELRVAEGSVKCTTTKVAP